MTQEQVQAAPQPSQTTQPSMQTTNLPIQNVQPSGQATRQQTRAGTPAQTSPSVQEKSAVVDSGTGDNTPTSSIPFIRFSDKPLVFEEPFAERVARLHKRGFSSDIIAAKLKATIAEVDLAIAAGVNPQESRGES
jgi:hypothetical protein